MVTDATDTHDVFRVDTTNRAVFVGGAVASDDVLYDPLINFYVTADVDDYSGLNVLNVNSGTLASTDIVAGNDTETGACGIGISSAAYDVDDLELMDGLGTGVSYVWSVDTPLIVGSSTHETTYFSGGVSTANKGATQALDGSGWTFYQAVALTSLNAVSYNDEAVFYEDDLVFT